MEAVRVPQSTETSLNKRHPYGYNLSNHNALEERNEAASFRAKRAPRCFRERSQSGLLLGRVQIGGQIICQAISSALAHHFPRHRRSVPTGSRVLGVWRGEVLATRMELRIYDMSLAYVMVDPCVRHWPGPPSLRTYYSRMSMHTTSPSELRTSTRPPEKAGAVQHRPDSTAQGSPSGR